MLRDRGGMGSHKHALSGRPGPRPPLKRFLAEFFNEELKRRTKQCSNMYADQANGTGHLFEKARSTRC